MRDAGMAGPVQDASAKGGPEVAVLLRTKNRPVFFRRALASLRGQSCQSFAVHIINDGGDPALLQDILAEAAQWWGARLDYVALPRSVGRSKALALALAVSEEPYILIHDDDDTLEPDFLARTLAYLKEDRAGLFAAVTTSNYDVQEHLQDGQIIIDGRTGQNGHKKGSMVDYGMYLSHIGVIMPITFLFRRAALAVSGGVETRLDYVEDHDLFLRVMLAGEIGIIEDFLCSYHHRPPTGGPADTSQHEVRYDYELAYKNNIIRKAMTGGDGLRQLQARFIQSHHMERHYAAHLSGQIAQLQEGVARLSQAMVELFSRSGR